MQSTDRGYSEGGEEKEVSHDSNLVRLIKPIIFNAEKGKAIDTSVVSPKFYNCFNYSLLSTEQPNLNLVVGITSARDGDGKTLVASNLAVSLAVANQRDTVVVDFSLQRPKIHHIFGTKISPGLLDTLTDRAIHVSRTNIKNLYTLTVGSGAMQDFLSQSLNGERTSFGLEQVSILRNVLYSLKQEFEFVIVDLPSIHEPGTVGLLAHQMDGILVVVNANRTKHEEIEKLFQRLDERKIIGFVFNRLEDDY